MKNKTFSWIFIIIGLCMLIVGIATSFIDKSNTPTNEPKEDLTETKINKAKKEVMNVVSSYMSSLTNDVNNMDYVFVEENTIYAVPIECILLYRNLEKPLGKWEPATDNYWAYVLVHYDAETSSYTYGFTFKDSEGYGMYPTASYKMLEDGTQIQKNLELSKPKTGNISEITSLKNWEKYNSEVNEETKFIVLEATDDGNNKTTCTNTVE